ncbi:hyaluronan and proteoglycan link protein 3-like [Erpetoichthys calabaricus]|uniref:hyaluronan and proteoglycan link protein 3-like n=1 Tax=Erpetoichthys calabaricus TaxID=27687 RepID=UPI00223419E1|nr:hyaluronan and proteoglycan link protein 3-like [Erpetoichthys calabaricus]
MALLLLLVVWLLQLIDTSHPAPSSSGFHYHDIMNGNGNGEIYFNGVQLHVETIATTITATQGSNVTLPCRYFYQPYLIAKRKTRVKWSRLPSNGGPDTDVLVAIGHHHRSYGEFKGRVHLRKDSEGDVSLIITDLRLLDTGKYRCEVIDGLEDESSTVELELRGVVFPYQPKEGRYKFSFEMSVQACEEQDATIATFDQLYSAWEEGLDWCNAGWLADGSVQYPITMPREPCGGINMAPGVRSYGIRHKQEEFYDVFCFSSFIRGNVYYLHHPQKLNFTEAKMACEQEGAHIAKVGQLYAAWKFHSLDRCDAGWLGDGSLRYPIVFPRANCGPLEPGVRTFGFPDKNQKHGVYCYKMT